MRPPSIFAQKVEQKPARREIGGNDRRWPLLKFGMIRKAREYFSQMH